jgi:hypothetical protein
MVWMNIKVITRLYMLLHEGLKSRHSARKQFDFKGYESIQRQYRDCPHPRCVAVLGIMGHRVSAIDGVTQNGKMVQTRGLRMPVYMYTSQLKKSLFLVNACSRVVKANI